MSDKQRVVEKIRKLLAMAEQSASPNEALIAAAKARELLNEYNLSQEDVILNDSTVTEKLCGTERQRLSDWVYRLAHLVAKTFECRELIQSRYSRSDFHRTKFFIFVGVEEDAEIAGHVFNFLFKAINRMKTKNKTQFAYGFIEGVEEKLKSEAIVPSREMEGSKGALVLAKKAMVNQYISDKGVREMGHSTECSADALSNEFNAGYEEGLNCEITPAVKGGSPEHSQLQLEAWSPGGNP